MKILIYLNVVFKKFFATKCREIGEGIRTMVETMSMLLKKLALNLNIQFMAAVVVTSL